jgi:hypothetical protein
MVVEKQNVIVKSKQKTKTKNRIFAKQKDAEEKNKCIIYKYGLCS